MKTHAENHLHFLSLGTSSTSKRTYVSAGEVAVGCFEAGVKGSRGTVRHHHNSKEHEQTARC
jgi:hypothetical protein